MPWYAHDLTEAVFKTDEMWQLPSEKAPANPALLRNSTQGSICGVRLQFRQRRMRRGG